MNQTQVVIYYLGFRIRQTDFGLNHDLPTTLDVLPDSSLLIGKMGITPTLIARLCRASEIMFITLLLT